MSFRSSERERERYSMRTANVSCQWRHCFHDCNKMSESNVNMCLSWAFLCINTCAAFYCAHSLISVLTNFTFHWDEFSFVKIDYHHIFFSSFWWCQWRPVTYTQYLCIKSIFRHSLRSCIHIRKLNEKSYKNGSVYIAPNLWLEPFCSRFGWCRLL